MSAIPCEDSYVYCNLPTIPVSEVIVETVHTEPDNLATTGGELDPTAPLLWALALILVGAYAATRRAFRNGQADS